MIDPTIQTAGLLALETAVNKALQLDKATQNKLAALVGKSFAININDIQVSIYILLFLDRIELRAIYNEPASTSLSGPLSAYFDLLGSKDKAAALINSELTIKGSTQAVMDLQQAIVDLDLDWESQLSPIIGDVPSHFLGQSARRFGQFARDTKDSFFRHLEEFIIEEGRLSPSKAEAEDVFEQIIKLKQDAERLDARLQQLKQSLKQRQQE